MNLSIVHKLKSLLDICVVRNLRIIGVSLKIPQLFYRIDRDVKRAVGHLTVLESSADAFRKVVRDLNGGGRAVVQLVQLTGLLLCGKGILHLFTDGKAALQQLFSLFPVYPDVNYRVKVCPGILSHLRIRGSFPGR